MVNHVWTEAGTWERYSKGFLRTGKKFQCSRCGCTVQTGPEGRIDGLDLEDSDIHNDCDLQVVDNVMES